MEGSDGRKLHIIVRNLPLVVLRAYNIGTMPFFVRDNPVPGFPRLTHFGYCGDDTVREIPLHVHLGYEIVFIESGHAEVVVRDGDAPQRLDADDVLITRPRIRHRFVMHGRDLAYLWFGLQTDVPVLRTEEHRMTSFPLLPPSEVETDWLGHPLFRGIFEGLGTSMGETDYLVIHRIPEIARSFGCLREEVTGTARHRESLIYASLVEIFTRLTRRLERGLPAGRHGIIRQLTDYIDVHYGEELKLDSLGDYTGYTPAYLSRLFSRETGITISRYLEDVRMARARELLAAGVPVGRVAQETGYRRVSHFSRRFSARHGQSPREWSRAGTPEPG